MTYITISFFLVNVDIVNNDVKNNATLHSVRWRTLTSPCVDVPSPSCPLVCLVCAWFTSVSDTFILTSFLTRSRSQEARGEDRGRGESNTSWWDPASGSSVRRGNNRVCHWSAPTWCQASINWTCAPCNDLNCRFFFLLLWTNVP